jgi:hypothetical protein
MVLGRRALPRDRSAIAIVLAPEPREGCGAATWGPPETAMQTAYVARGDRRSACIAAEKRANIPASGASVA